MARWVPTKEWAGQPAYIIGGGPSLARFNWDLLKPRNTIGCNAAYLLGPEICKVLVFGDQVFYDRFEDEMSVFGRPVVTSVPSFLASNLEWLTCLKRQLIGLSTDPCWLGWNMSTGAAALNLALLMGATRVYLLGFDMKLGGLLQPNWHNRVICQPNVEVYKRFMEGMNEVARELPLKYPGCEIWNVTDGSELNSFPKVGLDEHFGAGMHRREIEGACLQYPSKQVQFVCSG